MNNDKKILKNIKTKIQKMLFLCNTTLNSSDPTEIFNYIDNNIMDTPKEISLSLCHKTGEKFKGIGYCISETFNARSFDEVYDSSEEDVNLENAKGYLNCLIKDYNHLLDSIEGFEKITKKENSESLKCIFQKMIPWVLAILPYIIQIINTIKN